MSPAPTLKKTPAAIRFAVVLGGLILLAAAGYFFLVAPKKNEAKSLDQAIVQLDQQVSDQRAQATQAAGLSKILVADYNKLQSAMPNDPKMDELGLQLNTLANDTGISFDSYQPGTAVNTSAYQVLPIAVSFQGSFEGSRSAVTLMAPLPTLMVSPFTVTVPGKRPCTLSKRSRWALVSTGPRSLMPTTSISVRPDSAMARSTLRPIRPNPLIATRIVMFAPA